MPYRMRLVVAVCIVLALSLGGPRAAAAQSSVRYSFVLICDTYWADADRFGRGGLAKIATVLKAERARAPNAFIAHAGDAISPSLLSGLDRGKHMIDLLGMLGLDMFVPGNHEFDFGPDVFKTRLKEARFPVYAANLADAKGAPLVGILASTIRDVGGVRIGIAGLTADDSPISSSPGDLRFEATLDAATRVSSELRKQGADLVVLIVHAARPTDEALRRDSGADVILSGHDHDLLVGYDGKTAFAEAMQDGLYVVAVDLEITVRDDAGKRAVRWWPSFRIIDTAAFAPDPDVMARAAAYEAALSSELDAPLGKTASELDSRNAAVRGGEAAIGNLFADAVRDALAADVSILNGGGIRGNRLYPPGTVLTRRDVATELPFANLALLLELSGSELKAALEQGLATAERLTSRFPQVSGMRVRADLSRSPGDRVISVEIDGKQLDPTAAYRLATNDFMARGGDGYVALPRAKPLIGPSDGTLLASHVMRYIAAKGTVAPSIEGRIVVARERPPE